jgi:hypothetical protein
LDSVETGQIVEADSVSGEAEHLRDLSRQLAGNFLRPLDRFVAEQELHPSIASTGPPPAAVSFFNRVWWTNGRGSIRQQSICSPAR